MHTDNIVFLFLLIIIVAMCSVNPKNYVTLLLVGLIAVVYWKYTTNRQENFDTNEGNAEFVSESTPDFKDTNVNVHEIHKWDNSDVINQVFARDPEPSDGDQRLFDKMKAVGMAAQDAILHRARFTSDNFRPFFQEELDEQEKKIWWSNDSLDSKLIKDGQNMLDEN